MYKLIVFLVVLFDISKSQISDFYYVKSNGQITVNITEKPPDFTIKAFTNCCNKYEFPNGYYGELYREDKYFYNWNYRDAEMHSTYTVLNIKRIKDNEEYILCNETGVLTSSSQSSRMCYSDERILSKFKVYPIKLNCQYEKVVSYRTLEKIYDRFKMRSFKNTNKWINWWNKHGYDYYIDCEIEVDDRTPLPDFVWVDTVTNDTIVSDLIYDANTNHYYTKIKLSDSSIKPMIYVENFPHIKWCIPCSFNSIDKYNLYKTCRLDTELHC